MGKLSEIRKLIKQAKYVEALASCDVLLLNQPELLLDVLRQKSHLYSRQGNYVLAVSELTKIIDSGKATIGDFHSAAFWALYDAQFEQALDWLSIALRMGEDQNETWFRSNALHLTAYIYMELGEFEKAMYYLGNGESDDINSSFLIPNKGFCDVEQLRDEIRRRAETK